MLDVCYSHPVIDTNNFATPKKLKNLRHEVMKYLLNYKSNIHLDLIVSLVPYIMHEDNNMAKGMEFFNNL